MPALKHHPGVAGRPLRVGHKGAHHIAPGNTEASFEAALAAGVDMIEFDVLPRRLDGTGGLVLAHDYLDASHRRPLTLEEGLAHLAEPRYGDLRLDVDLKLPGYETEVVEALHRHGLAERALISTMEPSSIDLLREIAPEITVGRSFPRVRRDPTSHPLKRWPAYGLVAWYRWRLPAIAARDVRRGRIDALMCHWAFVTQRLVDAVTGAGGELYVWTVDDARRIARLEAMGVTGVISNDPRLFEAL